MKVTKNPTDKIEKIEKLAAIKKICEKDIEAFGVFFFSHHLKLAVPFFHKEIYRLYQSAEKRIAIAAPRGHSKSTITDLVYLAWVIVHKKESFILLVSDTYSQATLFLETLKAELEGNELLISFYGKLISENWSEGEIVTNGIMVKALGAGMKVRGLKYRDNRPSLIAVDDLENDELVESTERRQKLERWFNGALVPSLGKDGRVIVIGTILHYDSLLYKMVSEGQYTEFVKKVYRAIDRENALWPEHLNLKELKKIKQQYIEKGQTALFYQEYQNDPISGENRKFKLEKLKYYEERELDKKLLATYILIDRAYSLQKTADSTGIIVVSVDIENNWFIRVAERYKGIEKDLIDKIFSLYAYYRAVKIGIEQKAFQFTIKPALTDEMKRRNIFFTVEELKDGGRNKNLRIEGLLPRYETGAIFFKREQADLIDEMAKFPSAQHNDLVDSLSYGLMLCSVPRNRQSAGQVVDELKEEDYSPDY